MAARGTSTSIPAPRSRRPIASCSASTSTCATGSSRTATCEAVTADGIAVELLANVNGPADADMAGPRRRRRRRPVPHRIPVPDASHRARRGGATRRLPGRDRGGARTARSPSARSTSAATSTCPTSATQREANPFMGWRSIRLSSAYPEFFQTQLRAILRAGRYGKVSLLFPMISTLEEVQRLKRMVRADAAGAAAGGRAVRRGHPAGRHAGGAGGGAVHRRLLRRGRFRQHRLQRPDPVPDGRRPRQSQGGPPVRAVQPGAVAAAEPGHPGVQRSAASR